MKQLNFLFLTVLSCFFLTSCSEDATISETPIEETSSILATKSWPSKGSVTVAWSIGRKSKSCRGVGICKRTKTEVDLDGLEIDIMELEKTLSYYSKVSNSNESIPDDPRLLIEIDPVSAEFLNQQNGGYKIILEEDFVFENEYEELSLTRDYIINEGVYDLTLNPETGYYETIF